jgi:alpha-1,6-mannosyltransferase
VAYMAVVALILCALSLAVAFRKDRSEPAAIVSLRWLLVAFLALVAPHYPWYFLVLVPFLALSPSATAWVLTLGCTLIYDDIGGVGWPGYSMRIGAFLVMTLAALAYDLWGKPQNASASR